MSAATSHSLPVIHPGPIDLMLLGRRSLLDASTAYQGSLTSDRSVAVVTQRNNANGNGKGAERQRGLRQE